MNQFFYKDEMGGWGSFNLNKVVRSAFMGEGLIVLLDDGHERTQAVEVERKHGKKEIVNQRQRYQSEIFLKGADIERFVRASSTTDFKIPELPKPEEKKQEELKEEIIEAGVAEGVIE